MLDSRFAPVATRLESSKATIVKELIAAQGKPVDIGGYDRPDDQKAVAAMRPSATFNAVVDAL
jgi:isocitrate dehydrogenase